nr:hypothetical protein [Bacillus licheniformis]
MDKFLRLDLQHFAEGGEDGAGATNNPDPVPIREEISNRNLSKEEPTQQQQEKLLPQSDVNNLIAKETKKAQEKLLKQLGIEDFKSAKEGLSKFKEWQESQKTEAEKMADSLKDYETKYNTALSENESLKAQIATMGAGVQADAVQDVVTLAKPLVSDEVDMNATIEKVLEKYPHFKGEAGEEDDTAFYTVGDHKKQTKTDSFASALFGK